MEQMQSANDLFYRDVRSAFPAVANCIDDPCMAAPLNKCAIAQKHGLFIFNEVRYFSIPVPEKRSAGIFAGTPGNGPREPYARSDFCKSGNFFFAGMVFQRIFIPFRHGDIPGRYSRVETPMRGGTAGRTVNRMPEIRQNICKAACMVIMTVRDHKMSEIFYLYPGGAEVGEEGRAGTGVKENQTFPVPDGKSKAVFRFPRGRESVVNKNGDGCHFFS